MTQLPNKKSQPPETPPSPRRSPSMHEDVELWCDCCSCEAEPRWQKIAEELEAQRVQRDQAAG